MPKLLRVLRARKERRRAQRLAETHTPTMHQAVDMTHRAPVHHPRPVYARSSPPVHASPLPPPVTMPPPPPPPQSHAKSARLSALSMDVDLATAQARRSLVGLTARQENVDALVGRSTHLEMSSTAFEQRARRVRRRSWWHNAKWTAAMLTIGVVLGMALLFVAMHSVVGERHSYTLVPQ